MRKHEGPHISLCGLFHDSDGLRFGISLIADSDLIDWPGVGMILPITGRAHPGGRDEAKAIINGEVGFSDTEVGKTSVAIGDHRGAISG